jgi:Protein of unknown function (DUF3592)
MQVSANCVDWPYDLGVARGSEAEKAEDRESVSESVERQRLFAGFGSRAGGVLCIRAIDGCAFMEVTLGITVERMGSASNPRAASRALGCAFLPFFLLGFFFAVMVVREVVASAATYTWQSAPCQITESEVRESSYPSPWFAYLRYTWSTGASVRSSRPFGTYREAVLFTRRWPAGSITTCYLDPRDPAGALLERKGTGLALLLFLPIPLLFVFIGAVGFYNVVFRVQPQARVWHAFNPVAGRRFAAALLVVVGLVLFTPFLLGPVRHAVAARSWRAQECKILRSEVQRYATTKGSDSYSPEVLYSYEVDDREHRSDTYSFFESLTSGWTSAQRITNRYRPGSTVSCYVNPADADDATLNRNPSPGWLIGLLPFALLAGGVTVWLR